MDLRLRGTGGEAALFRREYPTEKAEAEGVARRISRLIGGASFFAIDSGGAETAPAEGETALTEIAVLIRGAALAPPVIKALGDHGIPFEFTGEKPWWEEEPALGLLKLLRDSRRPSAAPAEAVREAWDILRKSGAPAAGKREAPEFLERLISLAAMYDDLPAFLETLAIRNAGDGPEIRREGVRIMTIHASKGLEFDHVFIAALEEGLLPFTLYEGGRGQRIEEERRLLYVAMTRARRGLYLSWARTRNFRGRKLEGRPSRFLAELEAVVPLAKDGLPRPRNPQLDLF
jgi:superfamily I DNA/RNA helicase